LKKLEFMSGCINIILHTVSHIENLYWDESLIPYFPIHPDTSQTILKQRIAPLAAANLRIEASNCSASAWSNWLAIDG
jgi:hypothetical protein